MSQRPANHHNSFLFFAMRLQWRCLARPVCPRRIAPDQPLMPLTRRFQIEPLEPRRFLAVIVNPIGSLTVDEGSNATINATFIDSSPGGNYSAQVRWSTDTAEQPASVSSPNGTNGPLRVRFDYRYDSGFITAEMASLLETAAELVVGRFDDNLAGFASSGNNRFNATFLNPATGQQTTLNNFAVGANELIVFVAGRDLEGTNIAQAGAGGGNGTQPFFDFAISRGQAGVPNTDVAPWGGGLSFDTQTSWYTGLSAEGLPRSGNDFLSVAMHELAHILGFADGVQSFSRYVNQGRFTGPLATQQYDGSGSPPLAPDAAHWRENLQDGGQEVALDPTLTQGERKYLTELDFAALGDLGWQLRQRDVSGLVIDTNVYPDNGTFTGRVRAVNGAEQGSGTFQVTVRNVAPTIVPFASPTGRANTSITFSAQFTDPGSADTHIAAVNWGDGTATQSLTVDQAASTLNASHTYSQPGTYQANLGIQDDDGATTEYEFSVLVSPPPRGDWQNPLNPFDVNNNTAIDPLDALLVINELNDRVVSDPVTGLLPPAPPNLSAFLDVTGDDVVAPQDALLTINQLPATSNLVAAAAPTRSADVPAAVSDTDDDESDRRRIEQAFADYWLDWLVV